MENIEVCPVCSEKKFEHFITCKDHSISKEQFNIVFCKECGFLFTNPRPNLVEIGKYYESNSYISHHANKKGIIPFIYRFIRNRQFVNKTNLIKKYLQSNISVLDIGCGTGNFLKYCNALGWKTVGVEPDSDARKQANINKTIAYDLDYLNTTTERYKTITLWHVLEHVHDLNERLIQIKNLLDNDGIAIIAVPNPNSADARHYKEFWAAYDVPRHLSHFTQSSLTALFKKHGFNLVQVEPMKYDAFYVSIKSEEYKKKNLILYLVKGIINGLKSNLAASSNKEYSSLIYVFKK